MAGPTESNRAISRDWLYELGEQALSAAPQPRPTPGKRPATPPNGFPPQVSIKTITWSDWSEYFTVPDVPVAEVISPDDVADVCNWAAQNGYTIRAVGESHNWSPLLLTGSLAPQTKMMLVDTTQLTLCTMAAVDGVPYATFGTGVTMDAASEYLQSQNNNGASAAPGFAFPHMPAPGNLTLGGVLAIGGHGTLVPSGTNEPALMGGLSNLIVGFDAVVTDPNGPTPNTYTVVHFDRSNTDAAAFLVHLGRAFITAVTLRVVPNYYLQLTPLFPAVTDLFASPSQGRDLPAQAFSTLLDTYGRVEVLWFPYTNEAFAQCNQVQAKEIQPQVPGPYNYPWMNDITWWENDAIAAALFEDPKLTPDFTYGEYLFSYSNLANTVLNGTARDLEMYLKDTTLHVTLFGWVLQIPRAQVQEVASQFFQQVNEMLTAAAAGGAYPVNAAMEIRCTTIDQQTALGVTGAPPAALAATHSVTPNDSTIDTVIWLNVGAIPLTPGANEFFTQLEDWLVKTWGNGEPNYLRPEWSKAFAWTTDGPWRNAAMLTYIRTLYNQGTDAPFTFQWATATLAQYDKANLFTNPFLQSLFSS
ncbi:MAG: hypothetical protein QOF59_2738 [Actinomycetota bacterium]|nr:hypothetical protein [Actinomycetota bacterium]